MAEKNLPVPYKSQHDPDSRKSNADCGPASLAMALEFLGRPTSVGEVLEELKDYDFTTIQQLSDLAQKWGFNAESRIDVSFNDLKNYIDRGFPVIVVGGYGFLNSTQDKNFKASHIMLVVGYRADDSVYVNDPNFWGDKRPDGDHHVYTFEEFNNFWRNEGNKENNQPNIILVITPGANTPPQTANDGYPKKLVVTSDIGLRARTQPVTNAENIAKVYRKGTELQAIGEGVGSEVNGNSKWYQIKDGQVTLYVWAGAVSVTDIEKPKEEPKKEEPKKETPKVEIANVAVLDEESLKAIQSIYETTREILIKHGKLSEQPKPGFWDSLLKSFKL